MAASPFLKLYAKNTDPQPALTVAPNGQLFTFGGGDAHLFTGSNVTNRVPWRYERVELYGDGSNLTFVAATVPDPTYGYIEPVAWTPATPRSQSSFTFECHVLLLNGEAQNVNGVTGQDDDNALTTVGLVMQINQSKEDHGFTTWLQKAKLGDQDLIGQFDNAKPLEQVTPDWINSKNPHENLAQGVPGPLLQTAIPKWAGKETLRISVISKDSAGMALRYPYFAFIFESGAQPRPFSYIQDGADLFGWPIAPEYPDSASQYFYRITQRSSDNWLQKKTGPLREQWQITLESTGLEHLWNSSVLQYNRSLATVRPVNRVTLIPYFKLPEAGSVPPPGSVAQANVQACFLLDWQGTATPSQRAKPGDLKVPPFNYVPMASFTSAKFSFKLGRSKGVADAGKQTRANEHDDITLEVQATIALLPAGTQDIGTFGFAAKNLVANATATPKIRIGSLDLTFGGNLAAAKLQLHLSLARGWQDVPRLSADMTLPVQKFEPGGQDGLPTSEYEPEGYDPSTAKSEQCMDRRFAGSAPVVFPIVKSKKTTNTDPAAAVQETPYLLLVSESNPNDYSETVALTLSRNPSITSDPNPATHTVLVIDSNPFLVAQVDYDLSPPGSNSQTIALWNTGQIDGAAWQLQTDAKPFTLTLPPQVLGEEMPKATGDGIPLAGVDGPFDFRLGPPAVETLQASYTPQNFVDAPWNLRRILGYPGQRDPGAGVTMLSYELLYGLSCAVNTPMLRLAEIFSIAGRIPGRVARYKDNLSTKPLTAGQHDSPAELYELKRWTWSIYAELYNHRVGILEPRLSGDNYGANTGAAGASGPAEVFTLSSGVTCSLRPTADLYYTVDKASPAWKLLQGDTDSFPINSTGLKGGATWPFESPRLFHATVFNPQSSSAVINGLALSSLGGTGTQKVGFDKDVSSISSITEIGRNSKVSVTRLGRIGVFHNLARYVIEYERDVVASKQFAAVQTPLTGRPALRKVREYVEILEPIVQLSPSTQLYPSAGCVKSIEFKQRVIPVLNAWSSNVADNGWKIPLWYRPAATPDPKPPAGDTKFYYDRPSVVFNLAGADGADVECAIETVDQIVFYTETDPNADADPHAWPIVTGVDFVPVAVPAANPAFPGNSVHETPAYDPPIPFGLSAFTHKLMPGHGRVNLVNGRSNQAIGTTLANATLQRGPQGPAARLQNKLQAVHDLVRSDIFTAVRTDTAKVAALTATHGPLQTKVTELQTAATNKVIALQGAVIDREMAALTRYNNQIQQQILLVQDEIKAQVQTVVKVNGLLQADLQAVETRIIQLADAEIDAFFNRLQGIPAAANALAQFAGRMFDTLNAAQTKLNDLNVALKKALTNIDADAMSKADKAQDKLNQLAQTILGPLNQANTLLTGVRTQVQARAEAWMPAAGLICHVWENNICAGLEAVQSVVTQIAALTSSLEAAANDQIVDSIAQLTSAVTAATNALPQIAFDQSIMNAVKPYATAAQLIPNFFTALQTRIKGEIQTDITTAFNGFTAPVIAQATIVTLTVNAVAGKLLQEIDLLQATVTNSTDLIQKRISDTATNIADALIKLLANMSAEVVQAINTLNGAAVSAQESARRALESALGRYAESVAQALPDFPDGPSIDIALPSGLAVPAVLQRAFGASPAIPNLGFSLPNVAFFYQQLLPNVSLTPLLTQVQGLGLNLSPLSTKVPSFQLFDRAIPIPTLNNFDLSSVLPDFAGLKLTNLFPSLKLPNGSDKAVKVTHGLDTQSRQAWLQADIDLTTDDATIFSVGPMALQIVTPRFQAQIRATTGASGQVSRQTTGAITGDWQLLIGGSPMITLRRTALTFDANGKLHVSVSPDRVELSAALSFIQQMIALYSSPDSGFGIYPSLSGIETRLSMPIPDTSFGTSGITNLTFNFLFGLSWADDFELYTGFGLASPNKPFNLAVYILGGGGHLVATARYKPGGKLSCVVDMALDASAEFSIALGPISGNAHVNLGMRFVFNSGQGDVSLGIFLIIGGEVSILKFISASILLRLDATYQNGSFTCRGLFSITIKICWCFTFHVSEQVSCHLGSAAGMSFNEPLAIPGLEAPAALPQSLSLSNVPTAKELDAYSQLATNYISLIS